MEIKFTGDIKEAEELWLEMSPGLSVWDDWSFRYCFYKYFKYPVRFCFGTENGKITGLLPLQFNTDENYLEFFGGVYMEDNKVFVRQGYEKQIPAFYAAIKEPARLEDISGEDDYTRLMPVANNKYVIDLSGLTGFDDYINKTFSSKSKAIMRKKIRNVHKLFQPVLREGQKEDLEYLIRMNRQNFKEASSFYKPYRSEIFHDLLSLSFDWQILSVYIHDELQGVSMAAGYKDNYVYFNAGVNKVGFPNLGAYLISENIEAAIRMNLKVFDAGIEDSGWKERWHLKTIPQYKFVKNAG